MLEQEREVVVEDKTLYRVSRCALLNETTQCYSLDAPLLLIQRLFHQLGHMRTHTHTQGKRLNNQQTRGHYNPSIRVLTFTDTPNLIVCTLDNEWVIVFVCLCHLSKEGFKNGLFGQLSQKLPPLCYLYGSACCLTDIFPRRCHLRKNQAFLCCYTLKTPFQ